MNKKFKSSENLSPDAFRPKYHFSAPKGWLNDPNGFSYYNGEWHLFYQHNPHSTHWGKMHWGHAVSTDFVDWKHLPIALKPKGSLDNFLGCFSGSATLHNEKLCLMYTGVPFLKQHQVLAYSSDGIKFKKVPQPVIGAEIRPPHSSKFSFRDPKIIKKGDHYYAVIGANYKRGRQIALYKSTNLFDWIFVSSILKDEKKCKGIYECPDLILTDNGDILIYSVMFTKTNGMQYQNLHSSVYTVGNADLEKGTFTSILETKEFDYGCDYYAPQTVNAPDGRIIIIAWMQMWFRTMPTSYLKHGFAGIMTIPKEIFLENGVLKQKPVKEIYTYFETDKIVKDVFIKEETFFNDIKGESYRLLIKLEDAKDFTINLRKSGEHKTVINYKDGVFTFNRENSGYPIKSKFEENCNIRYCKTEGEKNITLEIFSDKSSVELIANDRYCMSNTIYPYPNCTGISFSSEEGCQAQISFSPHISE